VKRRHGLRYAAGGLASYATLSALFRTVRFERDGADHYLPHARGDGCMFVLWHGRLLAPAYLHRHEQLATLVSRSADGEYLSRLLLHWGYVPVRGSSSRGGMAAVRELAREARSGRSLVITPDGPRGPREVMKNGPLYVARLSGRPIIPVAAAADRGWWFEGWDHFLVPKPFSRVLVKYGEPFYVPRAADAMALERLATDLTSILSGLMRAVDAAAVNA
jgi:lysophospholipid acyltransferase (LPLAT)-like uncharacterized protein